MPRGLRLDFIPGLMSCDRNGTDRVWKSRMPEDERARSIAVEQSGDTIVDWAQN